MKTVTAKIDLDSCRHNCRVLAKASRGRRLFPVVKADGYGHGMLRVTQAVEDLVDGFCVFTCHDGVKLRRHGMRMPVLVMGGLNSVKDANAVAANSLWLAITSKPCLDLALAIAPKIERAFVKVQTGMHRLGIGPEEVGAAIEGLRSAGCRNVALMHHYSDADSQGGTTGQDQAMAEVLKRHELPYSASNSAATFSLKPQDEEFVRCGIAVYGCTPFTHKDRPAKSLGLRPAMSLWGKVIALQDVRAGGTVGYGSRWCASKDTTIAVVSCGYSHGYPIMAPDGTPVWINGRTRPVRGRVSMEMITVECPDGDVGVGDPAQLWGDLVPADLVAELSNTIGYAMISHLPRTVKRVYT